jgi:hypothetical protein
MPSRLEKGEITPIVLRNDPSEGGESSQENSERNDDARFEDWTPAATLQSGEWERAELDLISNR